MRQLGRWLGCIWLDGCIVGYHATGTCYTAPWPRPLAARAPRRGVWISVLRCCVARTAGGLLCHSLAIITDAAHMLSDVAGFLVGAIALVLTSRNANHRYSFGFGRAEVLGAPTLKPSPQPQAQPQPSP